MAQDNFKNIVIGSIMAMLFVFCIFSFFIAVGNDYGADTSELTNGYYDFSAINNSLSNVQAEAETLRSVANQGSNVGFIEGFFDGVGSFFSIAFSMFGFIVNLFDFIVVGTLNIIFANAVITGTIIAIIIIVTLFGIFRFLKQGD